jgi:ABC-type cobalamin/Fe3+-siderophores transport system ATPase subunit
MLLRAGTVIATGSPINVVTPSILQQAYGVNVSIIAGPDGYPVVIPPLAAPEQMRPSS